MKFFVVNGGLDEADARGPFFVFKEEDGQRALIHKGDQEDEAYSTILEHAGVKVDEYELEEFMKGLAEGEFNLIPDGSGGE